MLNPSSFTLDPKKEDKPSLSLKELYKQKTKKIVVNDVKWEYYTTGNSDKTILFLHGMGGAYDLWWQQIEQFKDKYKVVTYTLPTEIDNLEDAYIGIKAILKAENIDKFTAVGTSMGGYITQYLLKKMPERIDKVVFGNTFPPNDILRKENKTKSIIIPYLPEIVIQYFGNKSLKSKLLPAANNDTLLSSFLPSLPFSKKSFINRFYVVTNFFIINPAQYKYKKIPKLIIESNNDPLIPSELRKEIKHLYPDAEVYTFNKEGHFPYINAANEYNNVLSNFLSENNEIPLIETAIQNYFTGRKNADINLLKQVFNVEAQLMFSNNDSIFNISLSKYLNKVKLDGSQQIRTKILDNDQTGNMAFVKTLFEYNKDTYVDYLTLLKKNNKWKIITKTFYKRQ